MYFGNDNPLYIPYLFMYYGPLLLIQLKGRMLPYLLNYNSMLHFSFLSFPFPKIFSCFIVSHKGNQFFLFVYHFSWTNCFHTFAFLLNMKLYPFLVNKMAHVQGKVILKASYNNLFKVYISFLVANTFWMAIANTCLFLKTNNMSNKKFKQKVSYLTADIKVIFLLSLFWDGQCQQGQIKYRVSHFLYH